jgi:hypothetical protein
MDSLTETLALLRPPDLYPAWRGVVLQERMGILSTDEAARWKRGFSS